MFASAIKCMMAIVNTGNKFNLNYYSNALNLTSQKHWILGEKCQRTNEINS